MNPFVSIVVSTYNRKNIIDACISSIMNQSYSKDKYEIIIIDGSNDGTEEKINKLTKERHIRLIKQINEGLSNARNLGIKESRGDIIAFIDDDAEADKNWLKIIAENFENDNVACVGGKILPKFEIKKPIWLSNRLLSYLSIINLGESKKEIISEDDYPFGCNISFKKDILKNIGGFREDLGRKKDSLLSGEEIEICKRIHEKGYKIIYNPNSIVFHNIPKERLSFQFFIRRFYYQGVTMYLCTHHTKKNYFKYIINIPACLTLGIIKRDFFYLFSIMTAIGFLIQIFKKV